MWGLSHSLRGCSCGVFLTSLGGVHVGSFSHPEGVFMWGLSDILRVCSGGVFLIS